MPQNSDDLAAALPPSLTVDLRLPDPVHEAPAPEDIVEIGPEPVGGAPTMSVPVIVIAPPALEAGSVDEPEPAAGVASRAVVPLPEILDESAPASRPRRVEAPVAPGRRPRPEGLVQEIVYTATLHLVNLGDSAAVRERKALDARIARPFDAARFIPVLSRKGGVGATTITALVGMALADVRSDGVLALDANPDRGTLADRVTRQVRGSVRDLVLHAPDLADPEALAGYLTRDVTGLDVAASSADPLLARAFDDDAYNVAADLAAPHYGVVLSDTGGGLLQAPVRAAVQRADAVLVVSGGGIDEARLASEALTWLEANHYAELVENAVVALNASTQGTDLDHLDEIERHFRSRVRDVVRIPYDPALAAGSLVRFDALKPFTRDSARELAATLMDGIPAGAVTVPETPRAEGAA